MAAGRRGAPTNPLDAPLDLFCPSARNSDVARRPVTEGHRTPGLTFNTGRQQRGRWAVF